jgi:two-component system response regulator AtoC
MARSANVLIVDDDRSIRQTTEAIVKAAGMRAIPVPSGEEALKVLKDQAVDIVLLDVQMPGLSGVEVLKLIREKHTDIGVIMLSVLKDVEIAVQAMKLGALDYVTKDFSPPELSARLQKTLDQLRDRKELAFLRGEMEKSQRPLIKGRSLKMKAVLDIADKVADSPVTVLITGESGTGKEVLARYLHEKSERRTGPFVAVNLANIESGLVESTLFGHEKGAFTGATKLQYGRFEMSAGGTLFLDELAELKLDLQAKLLRALQEREIERVGGERPIPVDLRVVCATNRNLPKEVQEGRFREDLYWRLKVVPIEMPPLRDRQEDVRELAQYFLTRFCAQYGRTPRTITDGAGQLLENYKWPGNVRELENSIERAVLLGSGENIEESDLPLEISVAAGVREAEREPNLTAALQAFEKGYLRKALAADRWDKRKCALTLGIGYSTLKVKLKTYGIDRGNNED